MLKSLKVGDFTISRVAYNDSFGHTRYEMIHCDGRFVKTIGSGNKNILKWLKRNRDAFNKALKRIEKCS